MLDLDERLAGLVDDLERPVLHVVLDLRVIELAADEMFGIEDGVFGIGVESGITNKALVFSEGESRGERQRAVALRRTCSP